MSPDEQLKPTGRPTWTKTSNLVALSCAVILTIVAAIMLRSRNEPVAPKSSGPTLADQVRKNAQNALEGRDDEAGMMLLRQSRGLLISYCRGNPNDSEMAILLAQILRRLGQASDAELAVDNVLKQAPQISEALWLKGELVAARGGNNPQKFFQWAADSRLTASDPQIGRDIWAKYALQLLEADSDQQARQYLDKAAAAGLADARLAYGYGTLAFRAGDFEQARKHLGEAVRTEAGNARAWLMLASAQRQLRQVAQARASLKEALASCREKSKLLMELGQLELADGKPADAASAFASACNYAANRAQASLLAAQAFYQAGQFAQAMKYVDMASAENPPSQQMSELMAKIEEARFGPHTVR